MDKLCKKVWKKFYQTGELPDKFWMNICYGWDHGAQRETKKLKEKEWQREKLN